MNDEVPLKVYHGKAERVPTACLIGYTSRGTKWTFTLEALSKFELIEETMKSITEKLAPYTHNFYRCAMNDEVPLKVYHGKAEGVPTACLIGYTSRGTKWTLILEAPSKFELIEETDMKNITEKLAPYTRNFPRADKK